MIHKFNVVYNLIENNFTVNFRFFRQIKLCLSVVPNLKGISVFLYRNYFGMQVVENVCSADFSAVTTNLINKQYKLNIVWARMIGYKVLANLHDNSIADNL